MICKNCHTSIHEEDDYCRNCGAKVIRNRLTFKNLFEHVSETFFNYDNKLLRTLIDLVKVPEEVIGGYISGIRKRHVNPISFFGLTLTILGIEWLVYRKYFPEQLDLSAMAVQGQESTVNEMFGVIQDYSSIFMILLVPIYALICRIVFFDNKKYNYVELIVAFTYMMALLSLVGAALNLVGLSFGLDFGHMGFVNLPLQVIYITYCLKRLYDVNFIAIVTRMLLSFIIYMIINIGFFALIFLGTYLFEGKEAVIQLLEKFRPK